jgi:hypothetical protein
VKRSVVVPASVFLILALCGSFWRVTMEELPNFAPVAALAIFAGYYFRSLLVAACLPVTVMLASNYFVGGYEVRSMLVVNLSLTLPVLAGMLIRRGSRSEQTPGRRYYWGAALSSLAASCWFFLASNFGTWLWSGMYDMTLAGLVRCYVNAVPFFRETLAGDFLFTAVLFGGRAGWLYALSGHRAPTTDEPAETLLHR